jgi:hypothetical protein
MRITTQKILLFNERLQMQTIDDVIATELEKVDGEKIGVAYDIEDTFYSEIEKVSGKKVSSRAMRVPLKIRPGGKFGYYDINNGPLGTGDATKYEKGTLVCSHMRIAIQWTLEVELGTDSSTQAVIDAVRENLADGMDEFRRHTEAQLMQPGTGVLATVTTVNTSAGVDTITATTDGYGVRLLRHGQRVSVYNAARTTNKTAGGPVTISYIDVANSVIKIPSVTGILATDVILPEGLTGVTPIALLGIPYHSSNATTGSWLGLDRGTNPEIVGTRVDGGNAPLALPLGRLALNKMGERVGIKTAKKLKPRIWTHPAQAAAYESLGNTVVMINKGANKNESLDLYFGDNMSIAGVPMELSNLWNKKRMDFVLMSLYGRAVMKEPGFHSVAGRKQFEMRASDGSVATSSISYITADWQLYHKNPGVNTYIDNLAVPAGYE